VDLKCSVTPKDFSFEYPQDLIARYPADKRDHSRLLVLNRETKDLEHKTFTDICDYFNKGDVIVFNDSKVFPCRLVTKRRTGGKQEILLLRKTESSPKTIWSVLINNSKKTKPGDKFEFDNLTITILDEQGNERTAELEYKGKLFDILNKIAHVPLPPYMNREDEAIDKSRYQTVYAEKNGSVAAPTAGLHFTPELLDKLRDKGVIFTHVTLHVGPGTFLPVRAENIADHKMHTEYYTITQDCCDIINAAKKEGRKVTAVGTTTTRVLESLAAPETPSTLKPLQPQSGQTNIFIYPPFNFKIIDRLITNFHLPESTLLMLVSSFAERKFVLSAYGEAIRNKYRLFSYGDSMMIL